MIEVEEAAIENRGDYVALLFMVKGEWREVGRYDGGAAHVLFPEAWRSGKPIDEPAEAIKIPLGVVLTIGSLRANLKNDPPDVPNMASVL